MPQNDFDKLNIGEDFQTYRGQDLIMVIGFNWKVKVGLFHCGFVFIKLYSNKRLQRSTFNVGVHTSNKDFYWL